MVSRILIGVLSLLVILVGYGIYATGLDTPIVIEKKPSESLRIAYVTFHGPYHKVAERGPFINEQLSKIHPRNWNNASSMGIYYDKPGDKPPEQLRSVFGTIIPEDLDVTGLEGVSVAVIPAMAETIQVRYPLRTFFCILAGIFRVYPKIGQFWEQNGPTDGTAIAEIYDMESKSIIYMQGLGKYEGIMVDFPE